MHEFEHALRVSVVPPHPRYAGNALFEARVMIGGIATAAMHAHAPNVHWMDYCIAFREKARRANIIVETSDMLPLDQAHVLMVMGVPNLPKQTNLVRVQRPDLVMILVTLETALGHRFMFNNVNTAAFDAIITYDTGFANNRKYFPLRPRAYYQSRIQAGAIFNQRRVGCFIASNQPLHHHVGLHAFRDGWRFTWQDWREYVACRGELLTYRASVARHFISYPANTFDLYGIGWDGYCETRELCRGVPKIDVLHLAGDYKFYFALENHESETSLISERIWDGLYGGSVPVYKGNKHLARYIPQNCYINADNFPNVKQMLDFLVNMKEDEWERYYEAGQEFIRGTEIEQFLPDAAADDLLIPVQKMLSQRCSGRG